MKKYSLLILLMVITAGCKKSDLNLVPISSAVTANYYKTSTDMVNAVNAIYGALQSSAGSATEFMFGDLPSDDAVAVAALIAQGHADFDNFTSKPVGSNNASVINARYTNAYTAIARANTVLGRIDAIDMDAALKKRLIAETKFLRAYYYFNLVKVFGDVPLVLKEITSVDEGYTYGRNPAASVYAQIQQDMTDAAADLPTSYTGADIGRATNGAAKGMLARILMFQKKFTDAAPLLQAVIAQSPTVYDLLPNYADVFKNSNGNNKEILFAIQYTPNSVANGEGSSIVGSFNPVSGVSTALVPTAGTNADQPSNDLFNAYQTGDARRDINIAYATVNGLPAAYVNKYVSPSILLTTENGTDYPVLRYADILLMYAECLNEAGSTAAALPYINKVIDRAYGNTTKDLQNSNAAEPNYIASQGALRDRIMLERRLELAFEGLRFFDLVRTDLLVPVMNAYFVSANIKINNTFIVINNNNKLFPIPQGQIDVNPSKMSQNLGY